MLEYLYKIIKPSLILLFKTAYFYMLFCRNSFCVGIIYFAGEMYSRGYAHWEDKMKRY